MYGRGTSIEGNRRGQSDLPGDGVKGIAFIVAPDGAHGGGMGRVKDYIVEAPAELWEDVRPQPLVTRDGGGRFHSLRLIWRACGQIRAAQRRGELALVHVNMGDKLSLIRKALVVLASRRLGVPTFIHLHAVELDKLKPWMLRLLAPAFRRANAVILLGESYRPWLTQRLGVTETPAEVLWNGVPIEPAPARDHLSPKADPLHIVFLGSLIERKGVSDLIAALALLPPALSWRATFAGPGDIAHYRALAKDHGVADRIEFPGWREQAEVRALLAGADMMVLPSYDEGLPLVILEALALGTPVIATPVGAIPEVLTDEADILFARPGDREGLSGHIARLLGDPGLRQRLSDGGLATFTREFRMEVFCRRLFAIWNRHGGGNSGRSERPTAEIR